MPESSDPNNFSSDEESSFTGDGTDTVEVSREFLDILLRSIQQVPLLVHRLTGSTEKLARHAERQPSRNFVGLVVVATMIVNLSIVWYGLTVIRAAQSEGARRGISTNALVEEISGCLDFTEFNPPGIVRLEDLPEATMDLDPCAQRIIFAGHLAVENMRQDLRCQTQESLRLFVLANPDFGVEPAPVDPECE